MSNITPIHGLDNNRIGDVVLVPSRPRFSYDESCSLKVKFRLMGGIRDSFNQEIWNTAYEINDKLIRITYQVEINRIVGGLLVRKFIGPQKFIRKATIYWTRNPEMVNTYEKKIWAMIIREGNDPYLPTSENDARASLFDVEINFSILGVDIGRGTHRLKASAKASWGRHVFSGKGNARTTSELIQVTCV